MLISGFVQLRCGITAYHWQRIVQLSWFSCITHLCCLTFLREYFVQHRDLYFWRLPGMISLVIMLGIAFVPTAQYTWDMAYWGPYDRPVPQDFAICYFGTHPLGSGGLVSSRLYAASQQRMILSVILLAGGMLKRLWHLSRTPTRVCLHLRVVISQQTRRVLRRMHTWSTSDSLWSYPMVTLVYRPCLTVFLTSRVLADLLTSRAFEVSFSHVLLFWLTESTADQHRYDGWL